MIKFKTKKILRSMEYEQVYFYLVSHIIFHTPFTADNYPISKMIFFIDLCNQTYIYNTFVIN
jgi:hypothetical protein